MTQKIRRHDLDWLRVLVFALLIFYHVGMFFVPWGWHIKNNVIYDWMIWPMLFINQWRLPILFVISGMGTRYALSYRSGKTFAWERIKRLFIPLVVGIFLIVPPQVYIERIANAQFSGPYVDFFPAEIFKGIYPEGNFSWHHLWFLPYLLTFSLILIPAFLYLRDNSENKFLSFLKKTIQKPGGLLVFIIPLYLTEALVEPFFPVTHALINDWFTFSSSLFYFFSGFILISLGDTFWKAVDKFKKKALILGVTTFCIMIFYWNIEDSLLVHFSEAFFKVLNIWLWILAIFGYGAKYLNKKSPLLTYANQAVYPFYILHQTITVILAYQLMGLDWGLGPKFLLLSLGTFGFSFLIYEYIIRRIPFLGPLFGLKNKKNPTRQKSTDLVTSGV
ncbi:MAG: acyltransferase family protein [Bacteroidota bacterium]